MHGPAAAIEYGLSALVLLNDPTFTEAARALAARILNEGGKTTADRLNFRFREAVLRPADAKEQEVLGSLLRAAEVLQRTPKRPTSCSRSARNRPNEIDAVELASWTIVARAVLNLHEVTTRN